MVSFGKGCGLKLFPGVYTNVKNYRNWIVKTAQEMTPERVTTTTTTTQATTTTVVATTAATTVKEVMTEESENISTEEFTTDDFSTESNTEAEAAVEQTCFPIWDTNFEDKLLAQRRRVASSGPG